MQTKELDSFRLSDAVTFHDQLNPKLWVGNKLRPEVKTQLQLIAADFLEELGINDLDVIDTTVSGSNAAYSYTNHSDLDLHILVNLKDLPNNSVYKELFQAKKTLYNDNHDIKIHGVPVELYVQDASEPVISLGEYSIEDDKWIKIPSKRRANFDQTSSKAKYSKLLEIINAALVSKDLRKVEKVLKKIKQYRQAGLDKGGEFGPENLAFKALRSQGYITQLYKLRDDLHSEFLTIENMYQNPKVLDKPTPTMRDIMKKHKVPLEQVMDQLLQGIQIESEHTSNEATAREIALDHLAEDPNYYTKLQKVGLEESKIWTNPSIVFDTIEEHINYVIHETNIDWSTKMDLIDNRCAENLPLNEDKTTNIRRQVLAMINSFNDAKPVIRKKYIPVTLLLAGDRVQFFDVANQSPARTLATFGELVKIQSDTIILNFNGEDRQFPNNIHRSLSLTATILVDSVKKYEQLRSYVELTFDQQLPAALVSESASGYIPSMKQKNDPRYSTALTVDINPYTMKKDASKFGNKISRAGIPPTLNPSGKF